MAPSSDWPGDDDEKHHEKVFPDTSSTAGTTDSDPDADTDTGSGWDWDRFWHRIKDAAIAALGLAAGAATTIIFQFMGHDEACDQFGAAFQAFGVGLRVFRGSCLYIGPGYAVLIGVAAAATAAAVCFVPWGGVFAWLRGAAASAWATAGAAWQRALDWVRSLGGASRSEMVMVSRPMAFSG